MMQPLFDKVLVQKLDEDTQKLGAFYVPDSGKSTYVKGKVLAIGTGRVDHGAVIPLTVKVDDIVLYPQVRAVEVTDENITDKDVKLHMVSENDIIARF